MTAAPVEIVGVNLRKALADVELRVSEGEHEIARQRKVIRRTARAYQNTAPHEARLGAYLHVHAALVTRRHRLLEELTTWLTNHRRSVGDS